MQVKSLARRHWRCAAVLLVSTYCLVGCDSRSSNDGGRGIVTTVGMVTDIVRQVVGDKANIIGLMGEGVDPHLHDPTRSDVSQMMQADLIFYCGLKLEGRMTDTFEELARKGRRMYAVTDDLDRSLLRTPPEFEGHYDPHVWMDVSAWSQCVEFVAKKMSEHDPANAEAFAKNCAGYRAQLAALDDYVRKCIASIPEDQRVLVTAHDAFGYFSRAYKIPVLSAQGISTESEAGVNDINRLVDRIVNDRLKAIFVESTVNPKTLQAVIEGAGRRGHKVIVGGNLFSDAMGAPGTYEGTYIGMLDHNATIITRALGGVAPERGLNGKLAPK